MRWALVSMFLFFGCGDDDRSPTRGPVDAGPGADFGPGFDGGPAFDAGPGADLGGGGVDAGPPAAEVGLTFGGGCAPSFDGDVVVVRNSESIAVSSTSGGTLTGSVQLDLDGAGASETLSSQHRVDTGQVINVVTSSTWTNLAMDSGAVLSGEAADPIGGTLTIADYRPDDGVLDITFAGVTLQNPSDGTLCTVDGRLQTFRLSF
jgi:hypothetical protein